MFTDLVHDGEQAVQANQFLLVDSGEAALLDPGGNLGFNELFLAVGREVGMPKLRYLLASHADPDIIASLDRWLTSTQAQVVVSRIWERFVPHFCKIGKTQDRVLGVPDSGMTLPLGRSRLGVIPAHFLHAEGNFHFYDPLSRILFTGDLGASLVGGAEARTPVTELAPHLKHMEGFHRRYMAANKILRLWTAMVRPLDIEMIVPQHGRPIAGETAVRQFLDWLDGLACGVDLMSASDYQLPPEFAQYAQRPLLQRVA